MGLLGDFAAGAGAVGAQMSMEALRSTIEEERATRLAEMQNRFQTARDERQNTFTAGENKLSRDLTVSEGAATRTHQTGLHDKSETAADRRQKSSQEHAENLQVNSLAHAEYLSDQQRALQEKQLAISGGHLALAREQAMKGTQVIGEDGRVAFVTTTRGKDGKPVANITYLKTEDGKDFIAPKNISESQKLEFNALSERIKALDKVAADSMNPEGAQRARAEILVLSDKQAAILNGGKAAPAGPAVKDRFAPNGDKAGDAKFEDTKRQSEKAGPMSGPAPAARSGADPAADLLKTGEALEARNPELKALGNQMRLMDGNAAASARAAYLQKVRDIQSGATARRPIIPDLIR